MALGQTQEALRGSLDSGQERGSSSSGSILTRRKNNPSLSPRPGDQSASTKEQIRCHAIFTGLPAAPVPHGSPRFLWRSRAGLDAWPALGLSVASGHVLPWSQTVKGSVLTMGTRSLGQVGAEGHTGHPCQTLQILAMTQPAPSSHCRTLSPQPRCWMEGGPPL